MAGRYMLRMRLALTIVVISVIGTAAGCGRGRQSVTAREVQVEVTDQGFVPAETVIPKNQAVTLVVTRKTENTCATEIVLPSLNQRHALPLDKHLGVTSDEGG